MCSSSLGLYPPFHDCYKQRCSDFLQHLPLCSCARLSVVEGWGPSRRRVAWVGAQWWEAWRRVAFPKEESQDGKWCGRLPRSFNKCGHPTPLPSVQYINRNKQCHSMALAFFIQKEMLSRSYGNLWEGIYRVGKVKRDDFCFLNEKDSCVFGDARKGTCGERE